METSLKATEKATIDAEEGTEVHEVPARSLSEPLECLCMGKQMRWLVGLIETENRRRLSSIFCGRCSTRGSAVLA